jgi:hypothetical protein
MKRLVLPALLALASGCYYVAPLEAEGLTSFEVSVKQVNATSSATCLRKYGGIVPANVRGTRDCPYAMPTAPIDLRVDVRALDAKGELLKINKTVSFKVVPGELSGSDYTTRTVKLTNGIATLALVKASRMFGPVRVWVEDAPPQPIYENGQISGNPPAEIKGGRTYATGLSDAIWFEDPTLASMQLPENNDNRSSPLVNQFLVIGKNPESGERLNQSCPDANDPNDGQDVRMVITGTDNAGFFVTDLTACKRAETASAAFVAEPPTKLSETAPEVSYLPGTFGSVYVYNYSYPEGLYRGDLVWTISGSVQEFTSTTQLTFAAWSLRDRVRVNYEEKDWDRYLRAITPAEISMRTCGLRNGKDIADALCGFQTNNVKLESLESSLIKLRNVRLPNRYANCDLNGNGEVPFFCASSGKFSTCDGSTPDAETQCNIDCTQGTGPYAGTLCTEDSTFENFGQLVVEMNAPGMQEAGLDETVPGRHEELALTAGASTLATTVFAGTTTASTQGSVVAAIWCDTDVHYKFGDATAIASGADFALAANQVEYAFVPNGTTRLAIVADDPAVTGKTCSVSQSTRTRFNVTLKDAVPTLKPRCNVDDPNPEAAAECRNLLGASYDIVGHLRHVQPARPRWMVLPRDKDDICCRPGPGLQCPKPIEPCN